MKAYRKWMYAALPSLVLASFFAVSCGGSSSDDATDTSVYTNSNLPSRYSVTIPTSIQSQGSKTIGYNRYGAAVKVPSFSRAGEPGTSQAYTQLQSEVDMMRDFFSEFEVEFMMLDAAYSQAMAYINNATGTVPEGTLTITFTQAMANKLTALYPDESGDMPSVGTVLPVPALDITIDVGAADYNYTFQYSDNFSEEGFSMSSTSTIKWNTAKTKVYIARTMTIDEGMGAMDFSYKLSYDDATKTITLQMAGNMPAEDMTFTTSVIMRETGGANNEINLTDTSSFAIGGSPSTYTIVGKADNNGGVVEIEFSASSKYRETFDGNGIMTGQAYWDESKSEWTGAIIEDCSGYEVNIVGLGFIDAADATALKAIGKSVSPYSFVIAPDSQPDNPNSDIDSFLSAVLGYGLYDPSTDAIIESGYWGTTTGNLTGIKVYVEKFDVNTFVYTIAPSVDLKVVQP